MLSDRVSFCAPINSEAPGGTDTENAVDPEFNSEANPIGQDSESGECAGDGTWEDLPPSASAGDEMPTFDEGTAASVPGNEVGDEPFSQDGDWAEAVDAVMTFGNATDGANSDPNGAECGGGMFFLGPISDLTSDDSPAVDTQSLVFAEPRFRSHVADGEAASSAASTADAAKTRASAFAALAESQEAFGDQADGLLGASPLSGDAGLGSGARARLWTRWARSASA